MLHLRKNGKLIFTSSKEVIAHYTKLINKLTPEFQSIIRPDDQNIRAEIADLRRQMIDQLRNFSHDRVDDYFKESMASAESDQELYDLSNSYETILLIELKRIKERLNALRIS